MNKALLNPIYIADLESMQLIPEYTQLDLNADMMKGDLEALGIKIEARHFNMEKVQNEVD
jgi:hypothetical protein